MWTEPHAWNRKSRESGARAKVFCASMADVCEDRPDLVDPRKRLEQLIRETDRLQWILCTKRPENYGLFSPDTLSRCCVLATAERQEELDARLPHLLRTRALCRGVSLEPLLGPINLERGLHRCHGATDGECFWHLCPQLRDNEPELTGRHCPLDDDDPDDEGVRAPRLGWVIAGPETGTSARPCDVEWIRSVVRQCQDAHVPVHVKAVPILTANRNIGISHNPLEWPEDLRGRDEVPRG